jgi:hypothetical protein
MQLLCYTCSIATHTPQTAEGAAPCPRHGQCGRDRACLLKSRKCLSIRKQAGKKKKLRVLDFRTYSVFLQKRYQKLEVTLY